MTFKGSLNYGSGDYTLTINGTDYAPYVEGVDGFEWALTPVISTSNPSMDALLQIGSISLSKIKKDVTASVNLNPLTNNDFKEENLVIFTRGSVTVKARILDVEAVRYNPDDFSIDSARVNLTDLLGLVNRNLPTPDPSGFLTGAANVPIAQGVNYRVLTWFDGIVKELTAPRRADGSQYITAANVITAGLPSTLNGTNAYGGGAFPDGFDASQGDGNNPVKSAAQKAILRGYFIYCDRATEQIKFARYPRTADEIAPSRRYAAVQVETTGPETSDEVPADEVEAAVTVRTKGVLRKIKRLKQWPVRTSVFGAHPTTGAEIEVAYTIENAPTVSDTAWSQTVTETKLKFYGFPQEDSLKTDTTPYTSLTYTRVIVYNSKGLVTREGNENISQARGELNHDQFPGSTTLATGGSELTYYTYESQDDRPTLKRKITIKPTLAVFPTSTSTTPITAEWIETPYQLLRTGKIKTFDRRLIPRGATKQGLEDETEDTALGLDPDSTFEVRYEDGIEKPSGGRADIDAPGIESATGKAKGNSLGAGGRRKITITMPGGTAENAATLAQVAYAYSQHGRVTWPIERPLENDENLAPLQREDVGSLVLLRDGEVISFGSNGEIRFGYTGRQMATLASPITVPDRPMPPIAVDLTIAAIANASWVVNVPIIPIPLVAGGGTAPYTFSALSGLPAGVTVSGNQIQGTPTSIVGATTTTIQVEDDALDTDTTPFSWSVVALPASSTHYGFISTGGARIRARTGGILAGAIIPANAITDAAGENITDAAGQIITDAS